MATVSAPRTALSRASASVVSSALNVTGSAYIIMSAAALSAIAPAAAIVYFFIHRLYSKRGSLSIHAAQTA